MIRENKLLEKQLVGTALDIMSKFNIVPPSAGGGGSSGPQPPLKPPTPPEDEPKNKKGKGKGQEGEPQNKKKQEEKDEEKDKDKEREGEDQKEKEEQKNKGEDEKEQEDKEDEKEGDDEKENESDNKEGDDTGTGKKAKDLQEAIERLKEMNEDGSLDDVIKDLQEQLDKLNKQGVEDEHKIVDGVPDFEKKVYTPRPGEKDDIDKKYVERTIKDNESREVTGEASGARGILSALVKDSNTDIAVVIEYLLSTIIKQGQTMNDMFESKSAKATKLSEDVISAVQRERSPAQAQRAETIRSGDSGSLVLNPMVGSSESDYLQATVAKSILISIDDSGSMHSFLSAAMSSEDIDRLYSQISKDIDKALTNSDIEYIMSISSNLQAHLEDERLLDIIKRVAEALYVSQDKNVILSMLLASIMRNLHLISSSFGHLMGIGYCSEAPFSYLCGLPIVRSAAGGGYYIELSMKEAVTSGVLSTKGVSNKGNLTPEYVANKPKINEFFSNVHGGNQSAYDVGKSWGTLFKHFFTLSAGLNKMLGVSEHVHYDWAIGIMHLTDLFYEVSNGFVKGFYDGLNNAKVPYEVSFLSPYNKKIADFNANEFVDRVLSTEQMREIAKYTTAVKVKFDSDTGVLIGYDADTGEPFISCKIIFADLAIFSFGSRDNDLSHLKADYEAVKNRLKGMDLKKVIALLEEGYGMDTLLLNSYKVFSENQATVAVLLLLSKIFKLKIFMDSLDKDPSKISVKNLHEMVYEYRKQILHSGQVIQHILSRVARARNKSSGSIGFRLSKSDRDLDAFIMSLGSYDKVPDNYVSAIYESDLSVFNGGDKKGIHFDLKEYLKRSVPSITVAI